MKKKRYKVVSKDLSMIQDIDVVSSSNGGVVNLTPMYCEHNQYLDVDRAEPESFVKSLMFGALKRFLEDGLIVEEEYEVTSKKAEAYKPPDAGKVIDIAGMVAERDKRIKELEKEVERKVKEKKTAEIKPEHPKKIEKKGTNEQIIKVAKTNKGNKDVQEEKSEEPVVDYDVFKVKQYFTKLHIIAVTQSVELLNEIIKQDKNALIVKRAVKRLEAIKK